MGLGEKNERRYDNGSATAAELSASIYGFRKRNPDDVGLAAIPNTMMKLNTRCGERDNRKNLYLFDLVGDQWEWCPEEDSNLHTLSGTST